MKCRHCGSESTHIFIDLGFAPPSNAYLSLEDLHKPEKHYPLRVRVCDNCWLVQTEDYAQANELFDNDYAYFSSTSTSWLAHAQSYCYEIIQELELNPDSFVVEVASNDGYLLKNFVTSDIPCLGIEPTDSTADAAEMLGIPVLREFFGEQLGKLLSTEGKRADLIIGNNVYAHVPDINDFTRGLKALLKDNGTVTLEFPHLLKMLENSQFDTIYHEHFSYLSLFTVTRIFKESGLRIFDVRELPTHGGSLRVYGCHETDPRETRQSVGTVLETEETYGMRSMEVYSRFQERADKIKDNLLEFLITQKRTGNKVVAYGAAAKGNTLLNYAGVKPDLLPVVFDAAPSKQGKYMPGSHIPILDQKQLIESEPDCVLILPWNIATEVRKQVAVSLNSNEVFMVAVPFLQTI